MDNRFSLPFIDSFIDRTAAPWVLLMVSSTASPTQALLTQLHLALRAVEPQAQVVVRAGPMRRRACAYRLQGRWTRPVAAHAALVLVFSGLQVMEPRVPHS